jgi:hypothetical protein
MESIIRNVRDIDTSERLALEHVLGQRLKENQQIIIQVVTIAVNAAADAIGSESSPTKLPDWCNVFDGLSDEQVTEVEEVVLQRADLSRPTA